MMIPIISFLGSVAMLITTNIYDSALVPTVPGDNMSLYVHQLLRVNVMGWLILVVVQLVLFCSFLPRILRGVFLLGLTAISLALMLWNAIFFQRNETSLGEKEKVIFILNFTLWSLSSLFLLSHFACLGWLRQSRAAYSQT
jgi:hypothetical protein